MKFKTIFSFWALWRVFLFVLSSAAIVILPTWGNRFPYVDEMLKSSGLPNWLWQFGNFDGVHYIGIAKDGYIRQFTQAFFPVYPILLKIVATMFFNNFVLAGIFLSSVFMLLASWMFNLLLVVNGSPRAEAGRDLSLQYKNIKWILLFFLFFPMSFFFGAIYNESFFLFLVLACFYFAKKRNWLLAGIIGWFASGTRLVGVFLFPAILYEFLMVVTSRDLSLQKNNIKYSILNTCYLLLIPFGLLAYMLYLQVNFHDGLYFLHAQSAFGASRSSGIVFPLITLWRYAKILTTVPFFQYDFWVAFWEIGFFAIGGIILTIITVLKFKATSIYKKLVLSVDTSFLIFSWLCYLLPTLTGTLSSFPRYLLVCFPIYIFLGNISKKSIKILLLTIFLILNFMFLTLFTRGYWVS